MTGLGAIDGGFEDAASFVFCVPDVFQKIAEGESTWVEDAAETRAAASLLFCVGVCGVGWVWGEGDSVRD